MERTISLPVEPGDEAFVIWDNLIQKGTVKDISVSLTKPAATIVEKTEVKVEITLARVVKKDISQIFTSADDAATWLEGNVNPPVAP